MPDNPKVAVIKACFYDPQVNRTYGELAAHYDTAVLPARPRRPRDKAKVEAAVRIAERWLLGKLRHRRFYSLAEVNAAIGELLVWLNEQQVRRYQRRTRRQLFEELDAPRLKPLPAEPYALAEWRVRKVGLDYHVDVDGHFYSVPYRHARETVSEAVPESGYDELAEVLERQELAELLDRALALLPPETRDALVARYVEELGPAQIAQRLAVSPEAVGMRLTRGRSAVRRVLETELADEPLAQVWLERYGAAWRPTWPAARSARSPRSSSRVA